MDVAEVLDADGEGDYGGDDAHAVHEERPGVRRPQGVVDPPSPVTRAKTSKKVLLRTRPERLPWVIFFNVSEVERCSWEQ